MRVQKAEGHLVRRDQRGTEAPLAVGETVSVSDEVRTDGAGYALIGDSGATVRLGPDTQLQLRKQDESGGYELYLAGGSVEADSQGPRLSFFGAGTAGSVRIDNGTARLLADGKNGMVVASQRGQVVVENGGIRTLSVEKHPPNAGGCHRQSQYRLH